MSKFLMLVLESVGYIFSFLFLAYYGAYFASKGWYRARPNVHTDVFINPKPEPKSEELAS